MGGTRLIDRVHELYPALKHMQLAQAEVMRELIRENQCEQLLELGTASGKSAAFFAAILEELGRGHLVTLDRSERLDRPINVHTVLASLNLSHRVTALVHPRSFLMTLMELLEKNPRPQFDFAYMDGGKTWEIVGYSFYLVDLLLKPGAIIVFDDLNWTMQKSVASGKSRAIFDDYSPEEQAYSHVRKVWDLLVREKYADASEHKKLGWGIARKPL